MSLPENAVTDENDVVYAIGTRALCNAIAGPQRLQGRLTQLLTDCVKKS
jgi:hypothetical protein